MRAHTLTLPMRFFSFFVALLLAAPLFSGCADGLVTDGAGAALAHGEAPPSPHATPSAGARALDCAKIEGQSPVEPGASHKYMLDLSACGPFLSNTFSISGDGTITGIFAGSPGAEEVIGAAADNTPNGSFILTADFCYGLVDESTCRSLTKTVTITGPLPTETYDLALNATTSASSVDVTWDPAEVDPAASFCSMQVKHTLRLDGSTVDNRYETVSCTGGTFTDQGHRSTSSQVDIVTYTLRTYEVSGQGPSQSIDLLQTASHGVFAVDSDPAAM